MENYSSTLFAETNDSQQYISQRNKFLTVFEHFIAKNRKELFATTTAKWRITKIGFHMRSKRVLYQVAQKRSLRICL